jgi:uncharacterized protein YbjT (DUF2867 family)
MTRTVVVLGATGLVGSEVLRLLPGEPEIGAVRVIARRGPKVGNAGRWTEWHVTDLEQLDRQPSWFRADAVICALGTTMRTAGSRARFRAVDFGIPFLAARLAREQGTPHFLLVSSLGADARSRVFYSRVKGELEDAVRALGFPSLTIARPSLLLGERAEFRLGEEIAKRLAFLAMGPWRPIPARTVAAALVRAALAPEPGVRILSSAWLHRRSAD